MSTLYECPLGLSTETLAAWRDEFLPAAEARRIAEHVARCDACRARLAEFERLAYPLQAERAPEPDERLWLAIRAGLARTPDRTGTGWRGGPSGMRGRGGGNRRTWGTLAAVAAVVLLAVGFASLFAVLRPGRGTTGKPAPTVSPTATHIVQSGPPRWQTATWPRGQSSPSNENVTPPGFEPGIYPGAGSNGPAIVPSDGNTAYVCESKTSADNEQIWVTHNFSAPNRETQWSEAGSLPVVRRDINTCAITPDMNGAPTLLVTIYPPTGTTPRNLVSFDGGATWRELSGPPLWFAGKIATYQGKVYAIVSTIAPQYPQYGNYALSVSLDHMQTWQPVAADNQGSKTQSPPGVQFDGFWLRPDTGEILAHNGESGSLEFSDNGGQTWNRFQNDATVRFNTAADLMVQPPVAGQSWVVCGLKLTYGRSSSQEPAHTTVCTQDLGKAYTTLPNLPDTPAGAVDPAGDMHLIGITREGNNWSVLAMQVTQGMPKGQTTSPGYTLWRLPEGATQWQSLGIPPQYDVRYAPGALFTSPDSQVIMRTCPTCLADESDYVAAYQ